MTLAAMCIDVYAHDMTYQPFARVNMTLPPDKLKQLDDFAEAHGWSRSQTVAMLVDHLGALGADPRAATQPMELT